MSYLSNFAERVIRTIELKTREKIIWSSDDQFSYIKFERPNGKTMLLTYEAIEEFSDHNSWLVGELNILDFIMSELGYKVEIKR